MVRREWYKTLIKEPNISLFDILSNKFSNIKSMPIKQEIKDKKVSREELFMSGLYKLCKVRLKLSKNEIIEKWLKEESEFVWGKKIHKKGLEIKKRLISSGNSSRSFRIKGEVVGTIKEIFYPLTSLRIGVYCGEVYYPNSEKDVENTVDFIKKNRDCDLFLFPEAYPFSRLEIQKELFPEGTIFGRYSDSGPKTFFKSNSLIEVNKNTQLGHEKKLSDRDFSPTVIKYKGLKIGVPICYDMMNPKVSSYFTDKDLDLILSPIMGTLGNLKAWKRYVYIRGKENQCPVVVCSGRDQKREINEKFILYYNPMTDGVETYFFPTVFQVTIGTEKLSESPSVHWSWFLRNRVYGPYKDDF